MILTTIAWRNIWRNKRRSTVILLAISFGLWAGILTLAFTKGMLKQMIRNTIDYDLSHVKIRDAEFKKDQELNFPLKNNAAITTELKKHSFVLASAERFVVQGMVSTASTARPVNILGIDPKAEQRVLKLYKTIKEGSYFEGKRRNQVLLSRELAKKLKVKLRSKLVLNFTDENGQILSAAFRLVGIFKTPNSKFNKSNILVKRHDLLKLLNKKNVSNERLVRVKTNTYADSLGKYFSKADYMVKSWKDLDPYLKLTVDSNEAMFEIVLYIILVALGFGITNTMLMSVLERFHELGVLLAIGMKKNRVFSLVMVETTILSFTGAIVGLILAYLSLNYLSTSGVDLTSVSKGLASFGVSHILYPSVEYSVYPRMLLFTILMAIFASIYPALKAMKLEIVDAVRS